MRQILSSITRPIVSNYLTTDSIDLKLMIKKRFGVDFHERYVGTLLKKRKRRLRPIGYTGFAAAVEERVSF
jgi:hypothetical protein